MSRARVIRKVTKIGRDKRPKVAYDRRTLIKMERVKAHTPKKCGYTLCPYPNSLGFGKGGVIEVGTEHAVVTRHAKGRWMGSTLIPDSAPYHFGCVPPEARPLVRFFV